LFVSSFFSARRNLPLGKIAISIMLHRAGHLGVEVPVRFRFDGREIEIVEIFDHWYGPDYCYFKIKGNDGNLYILRFYEGRVAWELTMFQKPGRCISILSEPRSMH
jgi:hypothetical protein